MSEPIKKQSTATVVRRMLMMPLRGVGAAARELGSILKEFCFSLLSIFSRGRRNRNFDKAGQESQRVTRRRATDAAFRQGERERKRELIEAERESKRFVNGNSEKAKHYREQLELRKLEVSKGEAVNHLAKVNAELRAKERAAKAAESQSTSDQGDA